MADPEEEKEDSAARPVPNGDVAGSSSIGSHPQVGLRTVPVASDIGMEHTTNNEIRTSCRVDAFRVIMQS